jgi:hypothetical protein
LFDLRKIYVVNLKTGRPKKMPYVGEYAIVAVGLSGILKAKQKLGVTFNSDKLGGIDFTKISKLTMCSA